MKVLLISDKKNWAYAAIAQSVIKFNDNDNLKISHISCKRNVQKIKETVKRYDFYFILGWQNAVSLPFLDKKRTLVGVHSHQSFDNRKTDPEKDANPKSQDIEFLSRFLGVNTVSSRLQNILRRNGVDAVYTPNGVDISIFTPQKRNSSLTACCVAAKKNDWNKGVRKIIAPACQDAKVKLINSSDNKTRNQDMSSFYNKSHVYICASRSEGMPMAVLEAAACGCVIISTKCGDIVNLVKDGENGFLIPRRRSCVAEKLRHVSDLREWQRMSNNIRGEIVKNWSWETNAPKWSQFIWANCGKP